MKRTIHLLLLAWLLALSTTAQAYYDPKTRTFLSRDPLREEGGVNLYAYCQNDPVGNFDPIGLSPNVFQIFLPATANAAGARPYSGSLRGDIEASQMALFPAYAAVGAMQSPQVQGSLRMAGGVLETGVGALETAGTGGVGGVLGGGVLVLNGADNFNAGLQTFRSGTYQQAYLERSITGVAGNGLLGNSLYAATQLGMGGVPYGAAKLNAIKVPSLNGGYLPNALQRGSITNPFSGPLAAKTIDSSTVRFSQSSISRNFSAGGTIDDLAAGLRSGSVNPTSIPPIRLIEREGSMFTLDNRRLWSFQQAEVPIPYRMATPQEAAAEAWKFTTPNGGTSIRVRGQ